MLAAVAQDGEVAVVERPAPLPADGEVLVRVRGAGVNGADLLQVSGRYPPPADASDILGLELAGEVVSGGTRFAPGDRVMAIVSGGGQAELCCVPEPQLMAVPPTVELAVAGGFPEAFTTAHDALVTQCGLIAGDRLLVHGAAGGVGSAAVQVGRALGAAVTATVRDPGLRDAVTTLGAHTVIAADDFAECAAELEFDVILELVGAPNLDSDLRALAVGGRLAVIGIGAGARGELNLALLLAKRARILGSTLRSRSIAAKAATARALERDLLPLLAVEQIRVVAEARFDLSEAGTAYDRFKAGGKLGKILLTTAT